MDNFSLLRYKVKMASDEGLKAWVSDQLMSLLGYSQPTIVQYIIGLCNRSNSFMTTFYDVNFIL